MLNKLFHNYKISLLLIILLNTFHSFGQTYNYDVTTGTLGTTYSWIDCSAGSNIVTGDDAQAGVNWPFNFEFYGTTYTTSNSLSVCTNGFLRTDGTASIDYTAASNYALLTSSTEFGRIIAMGVYDGNLSDAGSWVRSTTTGSTPFRIFTIEYNNLEINYNANLYADIQVSFYETTNRIVLRFGTDNVTATGADLGIHSGTSGYFHKWQEVTSGTNNTWIEYSIPNVITTGTISGSPFTGGQSVSVPYTLQGYFNPGNTFTAQLSDASGSFASPTTIGSVVSNTSGTISATIPSGTLTGSGYRIRVVSNNPAISGSDNGANLTIYNDLVIEVTATVGTSSAFYAKLQNAFASINSGTHQGIINVKINGSTTETATAVLNASGTGSSSYSSVTIYPTITSLSVSGSLAVPLIQFNGADNVLLDGRVNQTGAASLTLSNTSTASGARTIELINSSQNNTIEYCNIKGAGANAAQGTVNISTSTDGTGNDGNIIQFNNLTGVSASVRPVNMIYSAGTATRENSENTIRNNNLYNFLMQGTASNGIHIADNSTSFTISANSFYETASFAPTASVGYAVIRVNNTSGGNFLIENNYIGGSAASASGLWTKTAAFNNKFNAIALNVGSTTSSVQGNTITNFSYANSGAAEWFGVYVQAGNVNVGTVTGNVIGAATGTGAVTLTAGATNGAFYGVYVSSTNSVNISNNTIGSITTNAASATNACHFYGVYKSGVSGTISVSDNLIGSESTANSIQTASAATGNSQILYGIYTLGTGNNSITGNTISYLSNFTTETTGSSRVRGIFANAGSNSILNNDLQYLKTGGLSNESNYQNASLVGISIISQTSGNAQEISGNDIHNLENITTSTTQKLEMYALFYMGPSDVEGVISRNFIHTFIVPSGSSTGHYLHGISLHSGSFIASNNIVFMGENITVGCALWGIWTNTANHAKIYHNTVYLTGIALNGTSNSYALRVLSCPASLDVRNNILWDGRVNDLGGVSHFAIYLNCLTNATVDYNDYQFAQQFGRVGGTTYGDLAAWQSGTSLDGNSLNVDPQLVNLGGTLPVDYQSGVQLQGISIAGQTSDFDDVTRVAPSMGAWEFFPDPVEVWNGPTFRQAYLTLKAAFDAINAGTWTGDLTIIFRGNTTETASAVLNASGTGSSSYSRILVYPGRSGVKVTGNLAAPLVDLNGADNITFDGRVNGTGTPYEFKFTNNNTSATAGTSVFRFVNTAQTDTIRYCVMKGGSQATVGGNIYFATATAGTGNSNNVIVNNKITSLSSADRPLQMVYSLGSATYINTGNKIQANEIYDFLRQGTASFGVNIGANSTAYSILDNSFYQTVSFVPTTASVTHKVINIDNTSGNGFVVSGNYIGGSAASATGTWTKTNTFNNEFHAIFLNVGTVNSSSIQGNFIRNFSYANSGAAYWYGIYLAGGAVNAGTTTGNTIGASTGTGSITVTNGASGGYVYPIQIASSGNVNIENNIIGSVTAATSTGTFANNLIAINKTATAGTTVISNNTIGSTVTSSSLRASSTSTSNAQVQYGISSAGTGAITVNNNIVANLTNSTANTVTGTRGRMNGIWVSAGSSNTVSGNSVYNLTIANGNTAATFEAAIIGINISGTVANRVITSNTIYTLSNTYTSSNHYVMGLRYEGATTGTNEVSRNFIHSLSNSRSAGFMAGIWSASGATTYSNNIITIGNATNNVIYGIYNTGTSGNTCNLFFNTVYIGGSTTGTSKSYAMYSATATNTRDFRNNIFSNYRTRTTGGSHFAIYYAATGTANLTVNYNDYWVSGTGGVLGYYPNSNRTTIAAIRTATTQDAQSVNSNPTYVSAGSTVATDYKVGVTLSGIAGTGITIDYGANSRPGSAPTMGAWESNKNLWEGDISNDWAIAGNWTGNTVPAVDATIEFVPSPFNHCVMDQNRSVTDIINAQGTYRVVTNTFKLTIKGELRFTNGAQIDASSTSSIVEFAGASEQNIPAGSLYNNQVYNLNINNASNVILNGSMVLLNNITSTSGNLDAHTNAPNFTFGGSAAQTIPDQVFLDSLVYNLIIDNAVGVDMATDITVNNDLTINSGKLLIINPAKRMTVLGTVTNNGGTGGLLIKSSSTLANGTFIYKNTFVNPVQATVEMYSKATYNLSNPVNNKYNWQFFGIPIRSIRAEPTFYGSFVRRKVEYGTTISNHWLKLTNDSILQPFVGYEISHEVPKTVYFSGELVNHNFSSGQLPITSGALYPGQHLFSNPYTAAMDIKQFELGSGSDGTIYLYNTGSFAAWESYTTSGTAPGQYIAVPKNLAGQAGLPRQVPSMGSYLLKFNSASSNDYVNIDYNAVVLKNTVLMRVKSSEMVTDQSDTVYTIIDVVSDSGFDKLWLFSGDNYTREFDRGYDGLKISGSNITGTIYAVESDGIYQVNAVDDINNTNISFRSGVDSVYTLAFTHKNTERKYARIYLHDIVANQMVDITKNGSKYEFVSSTPLVTSQRFRIITSTTDVSEVPDNSGIKIFSANKTLFVQNFTESEGEFFVYDLSGKIIGRTDVSAGGLAALVVPNQHVCIVKVITSGDTVMKSVIIQ